MTAETRCSKKGPKGIGAPGILSFLRREGVATCGLVAEELGVTYPTAWVCLQRLMRKGLVTRSPYQTPGSRMCYLYFPAERET